LNPALFAISIAVSTGIGLNPEIILASYDKQRIAGILEGVITRSGAFEVTGPL
jgi:hypothetical protein